VPPHTRGSISLSESETQGEGGGGGGGGGEEEQEEEEEQYEEEWEEELGEEEEEDVSSRAWLQTRSGFNLHRPTFGLLLDSRVDTVPITSLHELRGVAAQVEIEIKVREWFIIL
jgi:hypothetical protein